MDNPNKQVVDAFIKAVKETLGEETSCSVSEPFHEDGLWFIDISPKAGEPFLVVVFWNHAKKYGISSVTGACGLETHPDYTVDTQEQAIAIVVKMFRGEPIDATPDQ